MDELIEQANQWLKQKKYRLVICQMGDSLYVRGTLPPKPGSDKEKPSQQRIALRLPANRRGLDLAKKEADRIGKLLELDMFDWQPYTRRQSLGSVADWVERLKSEYFLAGGSNATWEGDYAQSYRKLPANRALSLQLLLTVAKTTEPNSKSRQRVCMAFARLARFSEIDPTRIVALRGKYSSKSVDPRSLPSDQLIKKWRNEVTQPSWRWCFGMMATYGIRPHELFHCDLRDFPTVRIKGETKTGSRFVWPLYPEWADEWELADRQLPALQKIDQQPNTKLGSKVSRRFYSWQLMKPDGESLRPYDLRHCFARRCLEFGFAPEFGAMMMGHSPETHIRVYRRWIDEQVYRAVYEAALSRSDRPLPP